MRLLSFVYLIGSGLLATCRADQQAFINDARYNNGEYGHYPHQTFFSRDNIESPRPNFIRPFTNCDDGSYLFVSLRGNIADSKPYILDPDGSLIWTVDHRIGEVYNLQVQEYKGQQYITYWAGDDSVGGHGAGKYYMLDQHYEEFKQIEAANDLDADLHDFRITTDNTALITVYEIIEADLSSLNPELEKGEIWDSLFQEIDLETGEALFQWRASEHVDWEEAYLDIIAQADGYKGRPWDFYHINTVDKDPEGNYLVSGRFTRSIFYINGTDGEIIWRLGGKKNSFTDLSSSSDSAITFAGQHDAHWTDDYSTLTFFDNRADWFEAIDSKSAGAKVRLDTSASPPTAELLQTYVHPSGILSTSQGSMQTLPNGNMLVGYGFNGVVTEFSPEGVALCDAYFEAATYIGSGDVQTYRAYKNRWTGWPHTPVDLALVDGVFYVSWLGATEVRQWELRSWFEGVSQVVVEGEGEGEGEGEDEGDEGPGGTWTAFVRLPKDGFESHYSLDANERIRRYVRAYALGADGKELGHSETLDVADEQTMWFVHGPLADEPLHNSEEEEEEQEGHHGGAVDGYYSTTGAIAAVVGLCGMFIIIGLLVCLPRRRRALEDSEKNDARTKAFVDEERAAFLKKDPDEFSEDEIEGPSRRRSGLDA